MYYNKSKKIQKFFTIFNKTYSKLKKSCIKQTILNSLFSELITQKQIETQSKLMATSLNNHQAIGLSLLNAASNTIQTCGIGLYTVATLYFCRQTANLGCQCVEKIPSLISDTPSSSDSNSTSVGQFVAKTKSEIARLSTTLILISCGVGLRWFGESITSESVQRFLFGSVLKATIKAD